MTARTASRPANPPPTLYVVASRDVSVAGLPRIDRCRPPLLGPDARRVADALNEAHRDDGRRHRADPFTPELHR